MIDREKVIKEYEDYVNNYIPLTTSNDYELEMHKAVLALLKEQEVVEPVLMREGRNEYYNDYVCPECDNELVFGQNFCSECGRQVKWDGRT